LTYLAPTLAIMLDIAANSPGLSQWMHEKRQSLPSIARALSITRPTTAMSILPPHKRQTTLRKIVLIMQYKTTPCILSRSFRTDPQL